MDTLFVLDKKDYDPAWRKFSRPSVRAVMRRGECVAMVYSRKYDYYKFPGGGIEQGEDHISALVREVGEETGLSVIPESVRDFGLVIRINKSNKEPETIFSQENYYYLCEADGEPGEQSLDAYEDEEGFCLRYILPQEGIETNRTHGHQGYDEALIEREARVLELLAEQKSL
ncbi:MAG: NUDIX domain-containing protein [Ruminococcus sp.]|nr:NUDIX domain-containing protein [Ruminococcus sp.]